MSAGTCVLGTLQARQLWVEEGDGGFERERVCVREGGGRERERACVCVCVCV